MRLFLLLVISYLTVCHGASVYALDKISKVKAAYSFNFTKFITWPDNGDNTGNLYFCVSAEEDFFSFFAELVEGKRVGAKKRPILPIKIEQAQKCDLVFVSETPHQGYHQLYQNAVLINASDENICYGYIFAFYNEDNKIRFEVDMAQIQRLNIRVSSELLKLARIK